MAAVLIRLGCVLYMTGAILYIDGGRICGDLIQGKTKGKEGGMGISLRGNRH